MISDVWPLFNLRIRTPWLELRLPSDAEIAVAAASARVAGIHDEVIPFVTDWSRAPSPSFEQNFARFHWSQRAEGEQTNWNLVLAAFDDGEPVGIQDIGATNFASRRSVQTGSWLLKTHQGRGLGKEMRAAVLELAFVGLDAHEALSESRVGNDASAGVSEALGYERNGMKRVNFGDQVSDEYLWRVTRDRWEEHRQPFEISIEGLDTCGAMFGVVNEPDS